jgi:diacylglycerol kinase (ATP)
MRAAAIIGLGSSPESLKPFQNNPTGSGQIEWRMGLPSASDPVDTVLLFGGDGTIHRHLGRLAKLGLPVLIVPAGSGNDFARALGLGRVRDSLAAWQRFCAGEANVRTVDLGVITPLEAAGRAGAATAQGRSVSLAATSSRYFCCVAGVGLDAEVSRRANHLPRWLRGHGGYALTLLPTMFNFAPLPMKVFTGGESAGQSEPWIMRSDQPTTLAAFANTPTYGGGMKIAPQAKMDDGLLDVCVVGGVDPFKLFCMFPTVYSGGHLNIREVEYFQARRVRVETERPLDVYADGEYVCRTPVEIGVERAALRVIAPGTVQA